MVSPPLFVNYGPQLDHLRQEGVRFITSRSRHPLPLHIRHRAFHRQAVDGRGWHVERDAALANARRPLAWLDCVTGSRDVGPGAGYLSKMLGGNCAKC